MRVRRVSPHGRTRGGSFTAVKARRSWGWWGRPSWRRSRTPGRSCAARPAQGVVCRGSGELSGCSGQGQSAHRLPLRVPHLRPIHGARGLHVAAVRRLRLRPGPTVGEGTVEVRPAEQLGRGVVGVVAEVDQGVDPLAPEAVGRWVKQAASEIVEDLQAALTELAATAETLEKAEIDSPRLTQPTSMGRPRCGCARQDGG